MTGRAFHSIILAGALLALPAYAVWKPARTAEMSGVVTVGHRAESGTTSAHPASTLMAVEIIEAGSLPVSRMVEIQAVPEPSSLLLLLPAGLLALRRRR